MKCNLKKRAAKLLALSLVIAVTICFVPQTAAPAYAESGDRASAAPAMVEGAESVLKDTANTDDAQKVRYAGQSWWVVSYEDKGNKYLTADDPAVMTLFAADCLRLKDGTGTVEFGGSSLYEESTYYDRSILRGHLDGFFSDVNEKLFSDEEQQPIISRTLKPEAYKPYEEGRPFCNGIAGPEVTCYLWPLSVAEADPDPIEGAMPEKIAVNGSAYWLRSPGHISTHETNPNYNVVRMNYDGFNQTDRYPDGLNGMRPAFYLDPNSILFTSAAEGVGDSGKLAEVGESTTGEWKLTLKDDGSLGGGLDGHKDFAVGEVVSYDPESGEVTVPYTGAVTGENEYISAIVKDSDGNITHYGRIQEASEAEGEVSFKIDGILGDDDTLYIFNEQYNGSDATGLASEVIEVAVPKTVSVIVGDANAAGALKGKLPEGTKSVFGTDYETIHISYPADAEETNSDVIAMLEDILAGNMNEYYGGNHNIHQVGYKESYSSEDEFDADRSANDGNQIKRGQKYYVQWEKPVKKVEVTVEVPKCGYTVTGSSTDNQDPKPTLTKIEGEGVDQNSELNSWNWWSEPSATSGSAFAGKAAAGDTLNFRTTLYREYGYYFDQANIECLINGVKASSRKSTGSSIMFAGEIEVKDHDWGDWTVTKEATETEEGVETRVCKGDPSHTETRPIPKLDGGDTPTDEEADTAPVNKKIPKVSRINTTAKTKAKTMTITFAKVKNAENYRIEYKGVKASKYKKAWTNAKTKYVLKNMKKNGLYQFRFAAYTKIDGKWQRGPYSNMSYRYFAKTTVKYKARKKSIKVKIKRYKNASGYQIRYSTKASMAGAKIINLKGNKKVEKTIKGLKKGKKYYVQVRPYKMYKGKKYLGILTKNYKVKTK